LQKFSIKIDRYFTGLDIRSQVGDANYRFGIAPGGLSDLLLLIGHLEKEYLRVKIGEAPVDLLAIPQTLREQGIGMEKKEHPFWKSYCRRVDDALGEDVAVAVRVKRKDRHQFQQFFQACVALRQASDTGFLPLHVLSALQPPQASHLPEATSPSVQRMEDTDGQSCDLSAVHRRAAELALDCPIAENLADFVTDAFGDVDEFAYDCALNKGVKYCESWCPEVAAWVQGLLDSKEYGAFVRAQINWSIRTLAPQGSARQSYDSLVELMRKGWEVRQRICSETGLRGSAVSDKLKEITNPFSLWRPSLFRHEAKETDGEVIKGAIDPFVAHILGLLSAVRDGVERNSELAPISACAEEEFRPFLNPDDAPAGEGTEWQKHYWKLEDCLVNSPAALQAASWVWLGVNLLAYSFPRRYDVFEHVGRKRQQDLAALIPPIDVAFVGRLRAALYTIAGEAVLAQVSAERTKEEGNPLGDYTGEQDDHAGEAAKKDAVPSALRPEPQKGAPDRTTSKPAQEKEMRPASAVPAPIPVAGPANELTRDMQATGQIDTRARVCPSTANLDELLEETLVILTPRRFEETEDRESSCKYAGEVFEAFLLSLQQAVDSTDQGQWQKACACIEKLFAQYLEQRLDKDMVSETIGLTSPDDVSQFYRQLFADIYRIPKFCEIAGKLGTRIGVDVQDVLVFGRSGPEDTTQHVTLARNALANLDKLRIRIEHDAKQAGADEKVLHALPSSATGHEEPPVSLCVDIKAVHVFVVVGGHRTEVSAFRNGGLPWKLFCSRLVGRSFSTQDVLICITQKDEDDPGETLEDGKRPAQIEHRGRQQGRVRKFITSVRNAIRKAGGLPKTFDPFPHDKKTNTYQLAVPVEVKQ